MKQNEYVVIRAGRGVVRFSFFVVVVVVFSPYLDFFLACLAIKRELPELIWSASESLSKLSLRA